MPPYEPANDPSQGGQGYGQQGYPSQGSGQSYPGQSYDPPARPARNGLGIAALVLGILSIVPGFFYVGVVLGIIAVILGFLARGRVKRGEATNGGMALAGIIAGIIGFVVAAIFISVTVLFATSDAGQCVIDAGGNQAALDACTQQYGSS